MTSEAAFSSPSCSCLFCLHKLPPVSPHIPSLKFWFHLHRSAQHQSSRGQFLGWAHRGGLSPRIPNNSLSLRGYSTDTAGTAADPGGLKHFPGTLKFVDSKENTLSPWSQALGVAGSRGLWEAPGEGVSYPQAGPVHLTLQPGSPLMPIAI